MPYFGFSVVSFVIVVQFKKWNCPRLCDFIPKIMFKQSVIALLFFRKIVKIERFAVQVAILVFTCTLPHPLSVDTRPRWPPVTQELDLQDLTEK